MDSFIGAGKYVNLLTDSGFKAVFGDYRNKEVVIAFINAVLAGEREVKDIIYGNNELGGKSIESKGVRFDLHCYEKDGSQFVVEMQRARNDADFFQRSIYYGSKLYDLEQNRGSDSYITEPVYVIGIMERQLAHEIDPEVISRYDFSNLERNITGPKTISLIFVQLGCFSKPLSECTSILDKWCFALKNIYKLLDCPPEFANEVFRLLFEKAEIASFNQRKLFEYEKNMMTERDYKHDLYWEKLNGLEEGKAEGELSKAKEIAATLKKMGMSVSQIIQATGLDEDLINSL